jgi:SpoVK/Ycf46/Vps4 family AAA+-type ATPase
MSEHGHHHDEQSSTELFSSVRDLPDAALTRQYDDLVGLDETKALLRREAELLLCPETLETWSLAAHGAVLPALRSLQSRCPMVIFDGDVGTGKTTLAESFGSPLAAELGIPVTLYRLSLAVRGSGLVGEMTALIERAFADVRRAVLHARGENGAAGRLFVLVVDEADSIAQSRDSQQLHHEDRAGVNAFIRGLDSLTGDALPVLVVLCTNRGEALDPAVRRRAARVLTFGRPEWDQRRALFARLLDGAGLDGDALARLAQAAGESAGGSGFTYSDLVTRVVPAAIMSALPDQPLTEEGLLAAMRAHPPTPVAVPSGLG